MSELKSCLCGGRALCNEADGSVLCTVCYAEKDSFKAWNTRPDSKPYKYANEDDLQDAKGWYTSEFQEAITFAFNAARELKE